MKKGGKKKKEKIIDVGYQKNGKGVAACAAVSVLLWILWVAGMYYLLLPALNLHSVGLWLFVIFVCLVPAGLLGLIWMAAAASFNGTKDYDRYSMPASIAFLAGGILLILFVVLMIGGATMFHASRYASILSVKECEFTEDIDQTQALSKIALMDTDSAILLGNREIGSLAEVVSQYNVSEEYSQIDYQGSPVKVSALDYAGFFKYLGNKESGIPGYVKVDPVGQSAEYVALEQGMNYVPSAYFAKDLKRHLRMLYPTKIFGNLHFEVDEDGNPYYVAGVYQYTIGLFGGDTVEGAIVCNPVDGTTEYYPVAEIPRWVDIVFDGDLLVSQYNWKGKLSNGFWNSLFGKKGCRKTTETIQVSEDDEDGEGSYAPDYGYVAKDGDIWIYTGVTSVNDDASNIGFILVNERTAEAHTYTIAGADESSAMSAAEGEVQEKGYRASFPSLINVDGQPTYVMVLKDAHGIVKLYAMVNVESYNKVTTASSIDDCFQKYRKLIGTGGEEEEEQTPSDSEEPEADKAEELETEECSFVIAEIRYVDIDGNTYVYLVAEDGGLYKEKFADDESLIYLKKGDMITAECVKGNDGAKRIVTFRVTQESGN